MKGEKEKRKIIEIERGNGDIKKQGKIYKNTFCEFSENCVFFRNSVPGSGTVPISSAQTRNLGPDYQDPKRSRENFFLGPELQQEAENTDPCCNVAASPLDGSESAVQRLTALGWPTCVRSNSAEDVVDMSIHTLYDASLYTLGILNSDKDRVERPSVQGTKRK